ncbi:MAG: sodium-dependent transporter [Anaerovoracaceae bacterium]
MENNLNKRDGFKTKLGFVMACIGSAVGMGNIWMFPYRVGQFGGASFLIPYFIFVALIGVTGVIGEITLGRSTKSGPLGAFKTALLMRGKKHGELIGLIPVVGSLAIAIGYSVVVGWILKFTVCSFTGDVLKTQDSGAYFGDIAGPFGSVSWHLAALVIVFIMMILGVSKGIEKVNKIMMPGFFIMFIILAIKVATLDNVAEGYKYLFTMDTEALMNPKTWVYALGQAFFSLSLAGSGTVVYGSYLSDKEDVVAGAKNIALFDTIAAMLAAVVIIPAVFAFNMDPTAGPPLMFITMPSVFKMMTMGWIFSVLFFVAVLFAGITSLVNLFESPIEALQQRFGLQRKNAVLIVAVIATIVGVLIENGDIVGKWMDFVSIYVVPLGALLAAIMVFWVCGKGYAREHAQLGRTKKIGGWFEPLSRYGFVGITIAVYVLGIMYGGI